ncbi:AAA family ATPase [Streptomyces sp. ZAF1911]|uniref:helix-turn-helix transcriptional regulator n=1 Tax=Streptomyces sp. ZAF1911 TaxID=2944129 RepID=UPI00237B985B|nr:LuxR family transcriptional regulator [Streptomyces sp. ZAF1911]MDD9376605.1 AAA family ATPase [Streptomyces sp. ZAF1911]
MAERDRELAGLAEVLDDSSRGRGSVALVQAGTGCGRTEMLDALRRVAVERGFLVLRATGSGRERHVQGGVVRQLLAYADVPGGLGGEWRRIAEVGAGAGGGAGVGARWPTGPESAGALHELSAAILRISERAPVLLCVDDIECADSLSLHWILHLVRNLRSSRIALVAAECTPSRSGRPSLHAELLRQPNHRRIVLEPLSPAAVASVLAGHLGAPAAAALAESCHRLSGGNPLLVRALVEDQRRAVPRGKVPYEPVVAGAYADTVLSCLHRAGPLALRLARVLAALDGAEPDTGLPARLLDEEAGAVEECRAALEAAGLLDGGRLRHPVARSAVLRGLSASARRELHRGAAELLHRDGANALRIAPHLLAAGREHPSWAVPVLEEASERHLDADRPQEAHDCLALALAVSRDEDERVDLRARLAALAWVLDPTLGTRHYGELARALRDGRLPGRHALALARRLLWHGRFEEAAEAVEAAGRTRPSGQGPNPDPATAEELRATRGLLSAIRGPAAEGRAEPSPTGTARADVPVGGVAGGVFGGGDGRVRAAVALADVLAHGPGAAGAVDAEEVLRGMRLGWGTQEWIVSAVTALVLAERLEAAERWCELWLAEARGRRVPLWEAEFASVLAGIRLRQGDPRAARRLAEAALALVPAESWGAGLGGPLSVLVRAATETGDHEAAVRHLAVPVPDRMFSTRFGLEYLHARGRHHLEAGRPYEALEDFAVCAGLMRAWGCDRPELMPWRTESARAHLVLGDEAAARALAHEQLALAGPHRTRTRGLTLRVLAATADVAERAALLTEAVGVLRAVGDPLETAGALTDLGRAHLREARPDRARAVFRMAARLAGRCGAQPLETVLAAELGGLGPRAGRTADGESGSCSESGLGAGAGGGPDGGPGTGPDAGSDTEPGHRARGGSGRGSGVGPGVGSGCGSGAGSGCGADAGSGCGSGAGSGCGPDTRADAGSDAKAGRRACGGAGRGGGALELLSDAERRVAGLAVGGYTNREISELLVITVSTVEQHLTRIFRKLGVRARRDLPPEIGADPVGTGPTVEGLKAPGPIPAPMCSVAT